MSGWRPRYQANCPRHADPALFGIIHAVVVGAVQGFKNDHPGCLVKNHGSLVKRICNQLTTSDVEHRLRAVLSLCEADDGN